LFEKVAKTPTPKSELSKKIPIKAFKNSNLEPEFLLDKLLYFVFAVGGAAKINGRISLKTGL
jgi:hypothetical protein